MPQFRKQGQHLTKDQRAVMADFSKGSKLSESLGKDGKGKVIMAKWAEDKQGNVRTSLVLADKGVGEKAFLTPQGGLPQTGEKAREAMLTKGISVGDAKNGAAIVNATFEPAREKDAKGNSFMVGARITPDNVKGMGPAQRNKLILNLGMKGDDGKLDPTKVLDAVNGRMHEVLSAADAAKKAPAKEEPAKEGEQLQLFDPDKIEAPAKNRDADLDRLAQGERTTVMIHVGKDNSYATGLEASNAGHAARYINLTRDSAQNILADENTISFEGPEGDTIAMVDMSADGTAKTRNAFKSYDGGMAKWGRERASLDASKQAVQDKLDAIQADAADDAAKDAPEKAADELEM